MKKQNEKDNFAKKYWQHFENLVIALLKKKLGDNNSYEFYIHKTPSRSDGGYDGIIFIEPKDNLYQNLQDLYTILTEAKLRKNENRDLPLSDFAKTLIIAINRSASKVYVYTNLHYSFETYQRVSQFSSATSLEVKLVDIFELCDELNAYSEIQLDFPAEFIQQLLDALPLHNTEKRILYTPKKLFENGLPKLTGDYRNDLLEKYIKYFKKHCGVFTIAGIQGSGKTLLIKHIMNSLQYEFNCKLLQLEKFTTIKDFFVNLLSIIWNVDAIDIYNLTEENIDEITSYMPECYYPRRTKSILFNILKSTPKEYEDRMDVFEEHLIEYLYYIFKPICQRKKQLLAFTNFEKSTDNILNFTNKFIRKFASENMIIITELRTDVPFAQSYIDEWALLNPEIKPIQLSEFSLSEYTLYMNDKYPDIDLNVVENLFSICYPLPIYIDNLISFIDKNNLQTLLSKEDLNIKKLYNNDKFKRELILYSVSSYFKDKGVFCIRLAYIVVFFDGEISLKNIHKLGSEYINAVKILADSIYFDIDGNNLHIHHILYLKAFQDDTILSEFERIEVVSLLYDIIDDLEMNINEVETKKLEMAIDLRDNDYVSEYWEKICNKLIIQNDLSFAKQLLTNIFAKKLFCKNEKLKLINYIIKCYLGLNEYQSSDLLAYIAVGEKLIANSSSCEKRLFYYQKARRLLTLGEYQSIITLTDSYRNTDPQLRYIRALSIKHIYGIDPCLLSLSRGEKHFPKDWQLRYAHLDHLHSKYEKIDYEKSWEYLLQIEQYYDKLGLEDQIHFQYNKIALDLYRTQKPNIETCKELYCKTFENILPVEMGRTHNLLGQIFYLDGNIDAAINEFEESFKILNQHKHATYIYVPLINLALLYDEQNDTINCIKYVIRVLTALEEYKITKIKKQLSAFNNTIIEKECAAFILSMELIQKSDSEIYRQYQSKFPEYNILNHSSSKLPQYYILYGKFTFRC